MLKLFVNSLNSKSVNATIGQRNNMKAKIKCTKFSCKRDNLNIRGFSYLNQLNEAELTKGKKLKPVVLCHSFLRNQKSMDSYARVLAASGYAAFTFDFCGGSTKSKSDGNSTDMTLLTEVQDLQNVVEYVSSLDYVDADELSLMGFGLGGLVVSLFVSRNRPDIKKIILLYPTFSAPEDARRGQLVTALFDPDNPPEKFECGPMKLGRRYVTDAQSIDVIKELKQYSGAVCIIHGDKDSMVDTQYSKDALQIYRQNSKDKADAQSKQLYIIKGATHGFNRMHAYYAQNIIEQFLENRFQLMDISVQLKENKVTREKGIKTEKASFAGKVEGEFFRGKIQEGAENIEQWKGRKPVSLSSSYVIKGYDYAGQRVRIDLKNQSTDGKNWKQEITTDSEALKLMGIEKDPHMVMEYRNSGPYMRLFVSFDGIQFIQKEGK